MKNETNEAVYAPIDLKILLSDFLKMARRLWWLALVLLLTLCLLFCVRGRRNYRPVYRASSTFTVSVTNALQAEVRGYNSTTADQMARTFPYILTSGALRDLVMRDLNIQVLPQIQASVLSNTNIFTLEVKASEPQLASDVLESVIRHYPDVAEFVVGPTRLNLLDESGTPQYPENTFSYTHEALKGMILAVLLWVLLVLAMSLMRSTVHNEDELKRVLNVRCMGTLPRAKRLNHSMRGLCPQLEETGGYNSFAEAVRLLRVRVEKVLQENGSKVLLVSSAIPGEGKTTVSLNLALSLAGKGKRTLLVDCDLRNPSVAKNLGMENNRGLVDIIRGNGKADKVVHQINDSMLYILPAGGPAEDAAELLAQKACRTFLERARNQFDYIILDTPPASLLVDASEIATAADAALLVIRQDYASRVQIAEEAQQLSRSGLPLIGCAINYTTAGRLTGYNSYAGYGYGGYGSGYGGYGYSRSSHYNVSSEE